MEIETNECFLRTINRNDAAIFYELLTKNTSRLEDYFAGTIAKTKTFKATKEYCIKIELLIEKREYIPFLLLRKSDGKAIGLIDFKNIDWNVPKAEIGAFIDSESEGSGIISESGTKLIDLLVANYKFKKIFCRAAAENKRSIKTILKYGFELEGTLRRDYKTTSGKLLDLNYYGKLFNH